MTDHPARSPYTRTELVWAGKRTEVDRVALPFQRGVKRLPVRWSRTAGSG